MDKVHRSPLYAVLQIDQGKLQSTSRSDKWRIDQRVGAEFQLDNSYYQNNPWDRGHMARRQSAAWGQTRHEAQRASDETFYFTNACLQHANVNQDEWLALEDWVLHLNIAKDGKIVVFSGPVYGEFLRTIRPPGRPSADIPSGFFKVVCFIHTATERLDVRAFYMLQDNTSIRDMSGRKTFNFQHYQVTISEIEQLTGLDFPEEVFESNPLFVSGNADDEKMKALNIRSFPERIDVNSAEDLVGHGESRIRVEDDHIEVYIAAAVVDPVGGAAEEWVSILNLEPHAVDLVGWTLTDKGRHVRTLSGVLQPGEARAFRGAGLAPVRLGNKGGLLTLFNDQKHRVDRVDYTEAEVKRAGRKSIVFMTYRSA